MSSVAESRKGISEIGSNEAQFPPTWKLLPLGSVANETVDRNRDLALDRKDVLTVDNKAGLIPSDRKLGEDFSRYKIVRNRQFAYNPMRLNVGSIALLEDENPAIVSPDYIVFECDENRLLPEFLDQLRRADLWKRRISQSGQGSVRVRYYFRHIAEFVLPIPPIEEQRAIAHVLRTVQQAKEATEKVIAAARQLKQSLMRHLFTYGPVPLAEAHKVTLKETEVGTIPAAWKLVALGEISRIGNGSTPKRDRPEYWDGGSIPWLTSGKIHEGVIEHADEFVTEQARSECHLPLVPKNSILVAITGQGKTLGNAALVAFDTCVSQHLAYIHLQSDDVRPEFVMMSLHTQYERLRQIGRAGGTTKGALTCATLKSYPMLLPPLEEQNLIVEILRPLRDKLQAELARCSALDLIFKSILINLMTAKIRLNRPTPVLAEVI